MRIEGSFQLVIMSVMIAFISSCIGNAAEEDPYENYDEIGSVSEAIISTTDADNLINDGRAEIGLWGGQCKEWCRSVIISSYGPTIPATAGNQFEWNSSSVVVNVAQWRGSYANGRTGPTSISSGASITPITVSIPNSDPQIIVLYASVGGVVATLTRGGTVTSVTSPGSGAMSGAISSAVIFGSGNATLTVQNTSGGTATNVVAVVLSRSRFVSDWETARRGDIMQMYFGPSASNRATTTPHTAFVQTDYNSTAGSCSGGTTTGCNWLDSNWVATEIVGAHNMTLDNMIRATAFSSSYGFTVYRLD